MYDLGDVIMSDRRADLRMLYQVLSSQIEFSKTQQWRVAYYGVLVLGGIAGTYKLFGEPSATWVIATFGSLAVLVAIFSTVFICKNEKSLCETRRKYGIIRKRFSPAFQHLVRYPENYSSPWYDAHFWIPLIG
jgi:hypothetical protein